jgi:hypothetical protein
VNAIHGVAVNITLESVADLTLLADEFSFAQLQCELSIWSLSTILESESRYILSELDSRQQPLARLVSLGFDESASRTMLILTRGNFEEALASFETLNREASGLSLFASSIPIHKCPSVLPISQIISASRALDQPGIKIVLAQHDGCVYSLTPRDVTEYMAIIELDDLLQQYPVASEEFPACSDSARALYQSQWVEESGCESVFVMEGLSWAAARTLMKFARGRYCLAWIYLKNNEFAAKARENFATVTLFNEEWKPESLGLIGCRNEQGRMVLVQVARHFTAFGSLELIPVDHARPRSVALAGCQDARDFLQHNPWLLG